MYSENNMKKTLAQTLHSHLIATRESNLQKIFSSFEDGEYRVKYRKTIQSIDFIDDSGAVNAYSVWYAIEKVHKPITWIMNISNLEEIADDLALCVAKKVKRIVIQGVYNAEVIDFFSGIGIEMAFAVTMEDAVRVAFYASNDGDAVLYSPGAIHRGALTSTAERSIKFRKAIAQL
jgi:UDP-N-acetylmuramoylalanine--D-glutamate ligase